MFDADLAVVGAGPAGLATAIAARLRGLSVILLDARHPPLDKACGEGLLPDAMAAAARLGLHLPADSGYPIEGIRFLHDGLSVEAAFPAAPGLAVRRTLLSAALTDRAGSAGVDLRWGVSVSAIRTNTITTNTGTLRTRWIAAADGERSQVRKWIGLDRRPTSTRYAFRQHFDRAPWTSMVEVYWGGGCQAYVTPINAGQVGVAVISRDPHFRLADAVRNFPELNRRLGSSPAASSERGGITTTRSLARVVQGPVALVGDASGSVDAITGEGIGLAFLQAELLAASLERSDLTHYQAQHAALSRRVRWMNRALLALDRRPFLAGVAMEVLAPRSRWFRHLVALHTGSGARLTGS